MTLVVAIVVAGVALFVALVTVGLSRRSVNRRLASVAARLEDEGGAGVETGRGTERALARIERGAEGAVDRVGASRVAVERLEGALAAVWQGVVVCDEAGEIIYRNARAEPFAGARHSDLLAERAVLDLLGEALAGDGRERTLDLYGPPRRILEIAAVPLDDGWRNIGALAVIDDVSERRRLDEVRRDFVANISHELKTPVGALGLLSETLSGEDDVEVVRRLAGRMQIESQRVGRIIDDLLDLSRIESEESPRREPVPVHLVVAQAAERVRSMAEHRRITVDVVEAPQRLTVMGDRRQLVSALYNLLENAVKYSDSSSTVGVRARTDGQWVELLVRDAGIGIPERDLERVFERFYRVDRARGRDTGGTGLGLAIVRHVAGNHGGDVVVESQEGRGSTFTLRVPSGPGPVAVSAAEAG